MKIDVIEDSIKDSKWQFVINPVFWDNMDAEIREKIGVEWKEVKFYNDKNEPDDAINTIPNDKGGIYVFVLKPNIIPDAHFYIMYIGRAKKTTSQNLRKRCKEYYLEDRPKISRLIRHWWKYIYIRYLPLDDNETIDRIEEELINTILPPCNDKIPNKMIQRTIKAFS